MIPIHLRVAGFLSYREPVELDFTSFSLACISGANGAGKSSLLDAITWCLFGTARKSDESLINSQSAAAEVRLTFAYEGNIYRLQRSRARGKPTSLEFQILQGNEQWPEQERQRLAASGGEGAWKALTERTISETGARVEQTLRMDYETFSNASFFLQGKADKFTQQGASDRKRILGSILGLDAWEIYRQEALERRRRVEEEVAGIDGQLREIIAELEEEPERLRRLQDLEGELGRASRQRADQETVREGLRRAAAALEEQQKLVAALQRQLEQASGGLVELTGRLEARRQERQTFNQALSRASEIEAAYSAWQASRQELESLEEIAGRFREQEKQRAELQAVRPPGGGAEGSAGAGGRSGWQAG
jgi:exonuclease SbcC